MSTWTMYRCDRCGQMYEPIAEHEDSLVLLGANSDRCPRAPDGLGHETNPTTRLGRSA